MEDLSELVKKLNDEAKPVRRNVVKEVQKLIDCPVGSRTGFEVLLDPLAQMTSADEVDSLRENAASTILKLLPHLQMNGEQFGTIVKLVTERCSQEAAEEIRLKLAKILHSSISMQSSQEEFLKHLDDLTKCLKTFLSDRYAEVIKETCDTVLQLSDVNQHFRLQADFLVPPLLQNLKTLPMKVKISCIKALHPVLTKAPLTIPEITPQLEKCWSDSGPQLKLAIVKTVGMTALEIESEDQNFHLLIPFLLLGTCNDFIEVSEEAVRLWQRVKNQLDEPGNNRLFLKFIYYKNTFSIIFFILIFTEHSMDLWFKKLVPDLLKSAEEWSNDVRIQTAQLLFCFLQELSDKRIEFDTVMEIIVFQAGDEEASVQNWVSY